MTIKSPTRPKTRRNNRIKKQAEEGIPIATIARSEGVSRQRIHAIIKGGSSYWKTPEEKRKMYRNRYRRVTIKKTGSVNIRIKDEPSNTEMSGEIRNNSDSKGVQENLQGDSVAA